MSDMQSAGVPQAAPLLTQLQRVTVTEQVPAGYTASYTKSTTTLSGTTTVGPTVRTPRRRPSACNPS